MSIRYRPLKERDIEDPVVKYGRQLGCLVRKMNGLGSRSWPDRMFIAPNGKVMFIEFKKPGLELTALQTEMHRKLNSMCHNVYVVSDVAAGRGLVDALVSS